jgi:thermostable 8-oxoguanine DNA glycosylase
MFDSSIMDDHISRLLAEINIIVYVSMYCLSRKIMIERSTIISLVFG